MTTYTNHQSQIQDERSLGDLFGDLSEKAGLLVRQEIQLAKVEMKEKASEAGKELSTILVGAFLGNAALLALVAALILGLANFMDAWLAALLVGGTLAVVAGLLVSTGVQALRQMNTVPERTMATLKEDKEWLKQQMS